MNSSKKIMLAAVILMFYSLSFCEKPKPKKENINLEVDFKGKTKPVNNLIFGNNIEWKDGGNGILEHQDNLSLKKLKIIKENIKPTSLRFPGGTQADIYHWESGIGQLQERKGGKDFWSGKDSHSKFGTDEFLKLCSSLNARPIITVNIVTGTPEEAAKWVSYVNKLIKKKGYPKVLFWEIGNEPYLEINESIWKGKTKQLSPKDYVDIFLKYAKAMRAVDPNITLGATFIGKDFDEYIMKRKFNQSWNELLIKNASAYIDYACMHNAYNPGPDEYWTIKNRSTENIFSYTYDSLNKIDQELTWINTLLKENSAKKKIKIAVTEYNSFFGIKEKYRDYIPTLGGTLYVANVLNLFLSSSQVEVSNYWSLLDNWHFGLLQGGARKRPNFYVMKLYSNLQNKQILSHKTDKNHNLKILSAKDKNGKTLSIYIINNELEKTFDVKLKIKNFTAQEKVRVHSVYSDSLLHDNEGLKEKVNISTTVISKGSNINVKPHSITVVEFSKK